MGRDRPGEHDSERGASYREIYEPPVNQEFTVATQFDLVVIGAGPGGYVAAIRAAQQYPRSS